MSCKENDFCGYFFVDIVGIFFRLVPLPVRNANHKPNKKHEPPKNMIHITNQNDITAAMEQFRAGPDGAFPTGRALPGQWEQANCQEWQENGTIHGKPAKVYYLFENRECESDDASSYPFDAAHVYRIEIEA